MPTIRVDDDVYEWLKGHAEPFVDTPNSVIRRMAGLDDSPTTKIDTGDRAQPGELLERTAYDEPILRVLAERGGQAAAHDVVEAVGDIVRGQLKPKDLTENKSGIVRWRNRVMWRRLRLVEAGMLRDDSPRGIWELSDAGWERAGGRRTSGTKA